MIKCKLCWCNRNGYKGLGCKLREGWSPEAAKHVMPCGVHENLMSIMVKKDKTWQAITKAKKDVAYGLDIELNGIDALSKEVFDLLSKAEDKMLDLCLAYQKRIEEIESYNAVKEEDRERGSRNERG